jgi:hypothetical protein
MCPTGSLPPLKKDHPVTRKHSSLYDLLQKPFVESQSISTTYQVPLLHIAIGSGQVVRRSRFMDRDKSRTCFSEQKWFMSAILLAFKASKTLKQ